jgi:hypothetical protein
VTAPPPALDRSELVGDVTRDVRLYCSDCSGEASMVAVVYGLEEALEVWAEHRARVHAEFPS